MIHAIERIKQHWTQQNIKIHSLTLPELQMFNEKLQLLPEDFRQFYTRINGMKELFPNDGDAEGFLFYPIEEVVPLPSVWPDSMLSNKENIYIFADYLHKSWLYGFEILNDNIYRIGAIPGGDSFTPVTDSLSDFIDLYISDAAELYSYS